MRIGLLDIGAVGALLVALLLPSPHLPLRPLYAAEELAAAEEAASLQADLARVPADGRAAARLADRLIHLRQSDWAIGLAQSASVPGPQQWRALLAVSSGFGHRLDVRSASMWAQRALEACAKSDECADFERMRVEMYATALEAGVASGIDPRREPKRFEDAVRRAAPLLKIGPRAK